MQQNDTSRRMVGLAVSTVGVAFAAYLGPLSWCASSSRRPVALPGHSH